MNRVHQSEKGLRDIENLIADEYPTVRVNEAQVSLVSSIQRAGVDTRGLAGSKSLIETLTEARAEYLTQGLVETA